MGKEMTFAALDDMLTKNIDDRGSIITTNKFSEVDEWIHSGNYLLNAQLSGSLFGGYPNSRSVALAGETGTGKTFLALNACREAQKVGYNIIFCDSEAAISKKEVIKFGIDPDKFRYQPINTPKQFSHFVANLVETVKKAKNDKVKVPKVMIVLDSLGNLSTDKSRADAISGSLKKDMTKAQEIKSLFSLVTMDLAEAKIPFILTAHTYASVASFYPQSVMGGGCFTAGTQIKTPNGLKNIEEFKPGDEVSTFHGTEIVGAVHEHTKELYEVIFSDGSQWLCSPEHRFFTGTKLHDDTHFTQAKRLRISDAVKKKVEGELKFEIVTVRKCKPYTEKKQGIHATVYDLTVPSNNYLLENNIISHNSGALYNTSIINFLYKAKLSADLDKKTNAKKESSDVKDLEIRNTGIVVRSTPHKNRFARPIQIRFHISFYHGMNPYVGLEQFISFKNCGIEKGNIINAIEFNKLKPEEQQKSHDSGWDWKDDKGKQQYFQPRTTARNYVCRHLNGTVPAAQLFTSKVFTKEILEILDETIIKPTFTLPDVGEMNDDFENLLDDDNFIEEPEVEDDDNPLSVKLTDFTNE
jgi:hypothetical protein